MPDNNEVVRTLPRQLSEFVGHRKSDLRRTLNDHVETIHLTLYEDEEYLKLLDAVYDEDAVEGSLAADNLMASAMIREAAARGARDPYVADKKLATISKALGVVLRRYGMSRKERARTMGGETVDNNE